MLRVLAVLLLMLSAAHAETAPDVNWTASEQWVWSRIAAGQTANFDTPCHQSTAPPAADPDAQDTCRTVRGAALEQMLTQSPWRDAMQHKGMRIVGARVIGGLDLTSAHVGAAVVVVRSRIEGDIGLAHARFDNVLAFDGSLVTGQVEATGLLSDSDVSFADGRQLGHADDPIGAVEVLGRLSVRNARIKGSLYLNVGHFDQPVNLSGVHVDEEMQTGGADFKAAVNGGSMQIGERLSINATIFEHDVLFPNSAMGGLVDATDSVFRGALNLVDSRIAGDIFLGGLKDSNGIDLSGTQVGGYVSMKGAVSRGPVTATNTQVAGNFMFDKTSQVGGRIAMRGARLGGDLLMDGAPFASTVDLGGMRVVGNVAMDQASFGGDLDVLSMQVGGDFAMRGAAVAGNLNAANIDVHHDFTLAEYAHFGGGVNLVDARVANSVHMERSAFDKDVTAVGAQIAGDMFLDQSNFGGAVVLSGAHIGGDLQLTGVRLGQLVLTGAAIDGALSLDETTTWLPQPGQEARQLLLVNAKVGGIQDAEVDAGETCPTEAHPPSKPNGWPTGQTMELDGFTYGHLGASAGPAGANMRERPVCWWRWWLERDRDFSSQPYVQLANVMASHGDQDNAADILYFGRVRETRMAYEAHNYARWMLLAVLNVVTGYGIGTYTFRALIWIVALTIVGMLLLWKAPGAGQKTWLWRVGASLGRVLPGIEINREFTDFFDDPDRKRLKDWQVIVFSAFVVIGWVLGLFLVAAMTGLTQHS